VKQSKILDFPTEKAKVSPTAKVVLPPRKPEERIITYVPKHRDSPQIMVLSPEEAEESKEMRRKGIEYHRMRMEK